MGVFGADVAGWRLSSAVALALAPPGLYLGAREVWGKRLAGMAAVILAFTPAAVSFAHLGYNNIQALPVFLGALGVFAWARRRHALAGHFAAGIVAGLGVYTFYAARTAAPLVLGIGCCTRTYGWRRPQRASTLAFAAGMILAVLPWLLLSGHEAWDHLRAHSFLAEPVGRDAGAPTLLAQAGQLAAAFFRTLVHGIFYGGRRLSFLSSPPLDPCTGTLAFVGIFLAAFAAGWDRRARLLLAAWFFCAFAVGSTSQYGYPPLTRLFFLAPFHAVFAAQAALLFSERLGAILPRRGRLVPGLVAVTATAACVAGGIRALRQNLAARPHGFGDGTTTELKGVKLTTLVMAGITEILVITTRPAEGKCCFCNGTPPSWTTPTCGWRPTGLTGESAITGAVKAGPAPRTSPSA